MHMYTMTRQDSTCMQDKCTQAGQGYNKTVSHLHMHIHHTK